MKTISLQRAEKIARNINAMDIHYQYCDNMRSVRFWSSLNDKLRAILKTLTNEDLAVLRPLCNESEAKYFGLV